MSTDQPASFPEVTKKDQSSTQRSANSTRYVVDPRCCCLTLTARTRQVSTATWRSRHRCDSQLLFRSLPLFAWETNRKWSYAQAAQQRCADKNVSVNVSANARILAHRTVLFSFPPSHQTIIIAQMLFIWGQVEGKIGKAVCVDPHLLHCLLQYIAVFEKD